ncbi:hypothetical protein B0H14DRAFT_2629896 [Mycena olivaceomarginata]|nr:hypothetical protein B0H14DRAFT_2640099 [Mycena olivaceomarginata]KAJ7787007.1 hypothetical protein B0H14DRAFT_2629896 [Mycena olivaceomarginata]
MIALFRGLRSETVTLLFIPLISFMRSRETGQRCCPRPVFPPCPPPPLRPPVPAPVCPPRPLEPGGFGIGGGFDIGRDCGKSSGVKEDAAVAGMGAAVGPLTEVIVPEVWTNRSGDGVVTAAEYDPGNEAGKDHAKTPALCVGVAGAAGAPRAAGGEGTTGVAGAAGAPRAAGGEGTTGVAGAAGRLVRRAAKALQACSGTMQMVVPGRGLRQHPKHPRQRDRSPSKGRVDQRQSLVFRLGPAATEVPLRAGSIKDKSAQTSGSREGREVQVVIHVGFLFVFALARGGAPATTHGLLNQHFAIRSPVARHDSLRCLRSSTESKDKMHRILSSRIVEVGSRLARPNVDAPDEGLSSSSGSMTVTIRSRIRKAGKPGRDHRLPLRPNLASFLWNWAHQHRPADPAVMSVTAAWNSFKTGPAGLIPCATRLGQTENPT